MPKTDDRTKVTKKIEKTGASAAAAPKATKSAPVSKAQAAAAKPADVAAPRALTPGEKLAAVRAAAAKEAAAKAAAGAAAPKVEQPAAPAAKPAVAPVAVKPAAKAPAARHGFKTNEFVVYPSHGVGQILAIEEQEVAGFKLELFIINFAKDKLTLKVPLPKVTSVGMRKLADDATVKRSLDTLTGRARVKRTMWSRRAQEYEAKINSGDLIAIAEVVRDLYRSDAQPEQSYSERQLYEAALDRMAREIAAVQKLTETEALKVIEGNLQKGPRRGAKAESDGDADLDADSDNDGDIDEAA
ncbi:CarD family transcriptional regulator [Methylovirgula sp. 4M-Z18]|uniref:CarD family transcriptional regulator n=1 Tax=Methylovirgula sp. 4M-Z18 TaxID=2293567 RepID=UPI001FE112CD|nr:CarD family transcriptional regulator [Methylovirgula sp. 4M-Z18]